jgi:hypothetical protein
MKLDLPNRWGLITSVLNCNLVNMPPPALTRSARPVRLGGRYNQVGHIFGLWRLLVDVCSGLGGPIAHAGEEKSCRPSGPARLRLMTRIFRTHVKTLTTAVEHELLWVFIVL